MLDSIINEVKKRLATKEHFRKAEKGTKSIVYLSDSFVVKINRNLTVLKNESEVLKALDLNITPAFVDFYRINGFGVLIEKKLRGKAIDDVWKNINIKDKDKIAADIAETICKINRHKKDYFWSAQFNRKFKTYKDLLFYKFKLHQKKNFKE